MAKAQATGAATTAVGEAAKDRAGGQKTSKGLTDKRRATAFGVSEQATPPAFFEADGMASASLHTDSSSWGAFFMKRFVLIVRFPLRTCLL